MGVGVGVSLGPAPPAALAGAAAPLNPTTPGEGVTNEEDGDSAGTASFRPKFSCNEDIWLRLGINPTCTELPDQCCFWHAKQTVPISKKYWFMGEGGAGVNTKAGAV